MFGALLPFQNAPVGLWGTTGEQGHLSRPLIRDVS